MDAAFDAWTAAADGDEDKAAVTAALEAAAAALKAIGGAPCAAHAARLVDPATALLKGEGACQVKPLKIFKAHGCKSLKL